MTVRVAVDSKLAEEVTVTHCRRLPRVGQHFTVTLGDAVFDFGFVTAVLEVTEDPPENESQEELPWTS